jgi:signal transduction histidine kinase
MLPTVIKTDSKIAGDPVSCLRTGGVIIVDSSNRVATLAGEARQLLGIGPRVKLPQPVKSLPSVVQRIVAEVMGSGSARTVTRANVSGSPAVNDLQIEAVPLQPGKKGSGVAVWLGVGTDVRWIDEHMRRLDRLANLGTLTASLGHEIKNALVASKTFIDLLIEKHHDPELSGIVRRELGRIDRIVSQMLKFAGPAKPVFSRIHLHQVLDHSLGLVKHELEGRSIALHRSYGASSDVIGGDDHELEQAFTNLLLNSLEAMGPHGKLFIHTEIDKLESFEGANPNTHLRVTIQDTGTGILPEHLTQLFEPFFTTKPNGTGLGLPITRRIIQEHRGEITVTSEPNKGATFSILLPAFPQDTSSA